MWRDKPSKINWEREEEKRESWREDRETKESQRGKEKEREGRQRKTERETEIQRGGIKGRGRDRIGYLQNSFKCIPAIFAERAVKKHIQFVAGFTGHSVLLLTVLSPSRSHLTDSYISRDNSRGNLTDSHIRRDNRFNWVCSARQR